MLSLVLTVLLSPPAAGIQQEVAAGGTDGLLRLTGDVGNEHERLPFALVFDAHGRFRADYTRAFQKDMAFDGQTLLGHDAAGYVHEMNGWERDTALLLHGLLCGNWRGGESPWKAEPAPRQTGSGARELRVTAGERPFEARVWVDPDTGLAERATYAMYGVEYTVELAGRRSDAPGSFPAEVHFTSGGSVVGTYRFERLETVTNARTAPFTLDEEPNEDATFLADASRELEVRVVSSGHTFVRAAVDGAEPGWFLFDTGSPGTVLDDRTVRKLDLDLVVDDVTATGAAGSAGFRVWRARELAVGPLRLRAPLIASSDLRRIGRALGLRVDGVLGADALAHGVWRYDLAAGEIALHPPGELVTEGATWLATRRNEGHLHVRAGFEEHEGWFTVDTGGGGAGVVFHHPTTERLGLLDGRPTKSSIMTGLGGSLRHRQGTLASFTLGGHTWHDVAADFPDAVGSWSDPYLDGLIGIFFLRPFEVVFDYPGRRIGLRER